MKALRVLVCGGDNWAIQSVAQQLSDEGVHAEASTQVIDRLYQPDQEWDLLVVDLDALSSLLRGLLPVIRRQFPNLSMLGIVSGSPPDIDYLSYDLELDGYMFGPPRPEDLIVRFPHLAANYLCDANTANATAKMAPRTHQRLAA
ncbi:MAG: hypothetical protein Kow0063_14150 [Anaerolineae bacterium]